MDIQFLKDSFKGNNCFFVKKNNYKLTNFLFYRLINIFVKILITFVKRVIFKFLNNK